MKNLILNRLPYHYKLLITFFLTVLIFAVAAGAVLVNTALYQKTTGIPGLKKVKAKYAYSPLRRAIYTSMKKHLEDKKQFDQLDQWTQANGPFYNFYKNIEPILNKNCTQCHGGQSTRANVSLLNWGDLSHLVQERGIPSEKLLTSTHNHLFGISLIILITSGFLLSTGYNLKFRLILGLLPFVALVVDVTSWWLCKISENFALLILIFGIILVSSLTINCILIIIDLWNKKKEIFE